MDVSPLAGQMMSSQRPSTRIHPITGWPSLLPSSLSVPPACLTVSLPKGRRHEVTTFHVYDNEYLRSALLCRWEYCPRRTFTNPSEPPTYLLVQALQLLWLVHLHGSYKRLLTLTIVPYPNPSPRWSFQERFHLTASTPFTQVNFGALSGRLHTRQGCTLGACFHRIAATGHWVQTKAKYLR